MRGSRLARGAAALLAVILLLFLDVSTKDWAAAALRTRGPRTVAAGHVRLQYSENAGIAFGRLRDGTRHSAIVAYQWTVSLALLGLLVHRLARRQPAGFLIPAGCVALLAGTLGNLHDRLERGFVIDFIDLETIEWPAFNIADLVIGTGMALCLTGMMVTALRQRSTPALA